MPTPTNAKAPPHGKLIEHEKTQAVAKRISANITTESLVYLESIRTVAYDYDHHPDLIPRERVEARFASKVTYRGERVRFSSFCGAESIRGNGGPQRVARTLMEHVQHDALLQIEAQLRDE